MALYRAFGHIISNAPVPAVITEAHQVTTLLIMIYICPCNISIHSQINLLFPILQILLVMVDSLAKLSMDVGDKDLVYSLLLVFSGMLMDEKGWTIFIVLFLHSRQLLVYMLI